MNSYILRLGCLTSFFVGLGLMGVIADKEESSPVPNSSPKSLSHSKNDFSKMQQVDEEVDSDITIFIKKLNKARTSSDFEALLEETKSSLKRDLTFALGSHTKMYMLVRRWGEIAPIQALEIISKTGGYRQWLVPLYYSWTTKDPERAVVYFEENQDNPLIRNNSDLILNMVSAWGLFDPEKAWVWFESQKGKFITGRNIQDTHDCLLVSIMSNHPKLLPQFLQKLKSDDLSRNAYNLGVHFANDNTQFEGVIQKLPEMGKIKAKAGKLMELTQENFNEVKEKINQFDESSRSDICVK